MKTNSIQKIRLAAIAVIGFALAFSSALQAQNTWYFVGGTDLAGGQPMLNFDNWNSQADGNGSAPTSFDTSHTWILNNGATRVGNANNDTFAPTLTVQGFSDVASLNWATKKTYLTQANVASGQALRTIAGDNTTCGLGITTFNLDGTMIVRGNIGTGPTLRHTQLHVGTLVGSGNIFAGDATQNFENVILSLAIADASNFTGVVRFRNTTGGFLGDTDLSFAELFIQQADHVDRVTTYDVRHSITVASLNIQGTIYDAPATYSFADLQGMVGSSRIQFIDGGGSITVVPEPATYALILGCLVMGALFMRRRKASK